MTVDELDVMQKPPRIHILDCSREYYDLGPAGYMEGSLSISPHEPLPFSLEPLDPALYGKMRHVVGMGQEDGTIIPVPNLFYIPGNK
jgi:hypothetical protein